nr:TniQ family protein [Agrobacterium rosae]
MLRLRTADLHEGETLTSVWSRVATANGRTMDELCRDMGLKTRDVINGQAEAVQTVAETLRMPVTEIARIAIVRRGNSFVCTGESFSPRYFNRTNFRFCPKCLEQDMNDTSSRPSIRRYGRAIWSSRFIRTCFTHQCSMADAGPPPNARWNHDFCLLLNKLRPEIREASERSHAQMPTAFERFVADRIAGLKNHGNFLDSVGLQAGADLCELSGMALRDGKEYRSLGRTEQEWHDAAQLGYEFLCRGVSGWQELLEFHCNSADRSKALVGGNAIYGQLHRTLARVRPGADYDRIRNEMRNFAIESLNLTSETVIFGQKVATSRISSRQVVERHGRDSRVVRKLLLAIGAPGSAEDGESGTTFDEAAATFAAEKLADAVKGLEAGRLLGVGIATQKIILDEGYLVPMVERNRSIKLGRLFSRVEIRDLLERLFPKEPCVDVVDLYPFEIATRRANATQGEILKLLIQRKLVRVGVDNEVHGIRGLLLDPSEIALHTRLPNHGCLTLDEVRIAMTTSWYVVKALISEGYLVTRSERNPVTRMRQAVVDPAELARFRSEYITFDGIMAERNITRPKLVSLLKMNSIKPALPVETIRASFYRRLDVAVVFADQ